jgi:RNA polymerase sigma factor (sigma-70 family)
MPHGVSSSASDSRSPGARDFHTTHWSVIVSAQGDGSGAQESLAKLCQAYWYPLYAFVRRQGVSEHDAEDLTQEFFARLLEKGWLDGVDRERGRFRSWLLASMKHFLANEWDRAGALKRGGGAAVISLDALTAEQRYALEPADTASAEKLFDRCWAFQLLDQVLARLRAEFEESGKAQLFDELKGAIIGDSAPYAEIATRLGATESAVKAAAHRLRVRYRELLRAEIAATVVLCEQIDDELSQLFSALRS